MKKLTATLITLNLIAYTAIANATPYNEHTGAYAEINLGANVYYAHASLFGEDYNSKGIYGAGWSTDMGYNFTHLFALEGGFVQNYFNITSKTGTHLNHINTIYVAPRFTAAIDERFSLFGKIGVANLRASHENGNGFLPYLGIGGSYALTPALELNAQYQGVIYTIPGFAFLNAGLISAGVTYHFG